MARYFIVNHIVITFVLKYLLLTYVYDIGLLLSLLHWVGLIQSAENASTYQNFLITIEMLLAAILLWCAFPYQYYRGLCKDSQGRGIPMQNISVHFRETLNPHDVVNDAIHNFSRVYQQYAIQDDLSDSDNIDKTSSTPTKRHNLDYSSKYSSREKNANNEKAILLVESDEDEIL